MHYNGSVYGRTTIKKKEVEVIIKPMWKKVLQKVDIPVYIAVGIWMIWLYFG